MIWWRSATHVAGLDPRSLKYDRPEVGERGLASSTPPSFASGWIESPGDDIANGGWRKARRSKAQLQRGADRQTVGWWNGAAFSSFNALLVSFLSFQGHVGWFAARSSKFVRNDLWGVIEDDNQDDARCKWVSR